MKPERYRIITHAEKIFDSYVDTIFGKAIRNEMVDAFMQGYDFAQEENKWVPVTERLPEDGEYCNFSTAHIQGCKDRETSYDRDVMQAWQMIKNTPQGTREIFPEWWEEEVPAVNLTLEELEEIKKESHSLGISDAMFALREILTREQMQLLESLRK